MYDRVRNALEFLAKLYGKIAAQERLALAAVLVGLGGGGVVGKVGYVASRTTENTYEGNMPPFHIPHASAHDVFLGDKGWFSDADLAEWLGVTVDPDTGRVAGVDLKGCSLAGKIPQELAKLTALRALDLRDNRELVLPAGMQPTHASPSGELGLLDMTGQILFTEGNDGEARAQAFLRHLARSDAEQRVIVAAAGLVALHGPDAHALKALHDANDGAAWRPAQNRWFTAGLPDVADWAGVVCDEDGRVVGLDLVKAAGPKRNLQVLAGDGLGDLVVLRDLSLRSVAIRRADVVGFRVLQVLPDAVWQLPSLNKLDLGGCSSLASLPDAIGQLGSLTELDLYGCSSLVSLPDTIGQLGSLKELSVRSCRWLTALPDAIGQLGSLETFDLEDCRRLTKLPKSIGQLGSLVKLNLEDCRSLAVLPDALGQLASLEVLNLSECGSLAALPDAIGRLTSLKELILQACKRLATFPDVSGLVASGLDIDTLKNENRFLNENLFSWRASGYKAYGQGAPQSFGFDANDDDDGDDGHLELASSSSAGASSPNTARKGKGIKRSERKGSILNGFDNSTANA